MTVAGLARGDRADDLEPSARALAHHAAWNYCALVFQLGGSLALVALAFRQLPASDVGIFALTSVTVGLVQILDPAAGFVMSRVVAERDIGRTDNDRVVAELRAGLRAVACALGGIAAVGVTLAWLLRVPGAEGGRLVMIAGVALATCLQLATASLPAIAVGIGDYRALCGSSAVTAVATLACAWVLLPKMGIATLGIALLAGQVLGRGLLHILLGGQARSIPAASPSPKAALAVLWSRSGSIYLSTLAAQLLSVSDLWTVGALRGTESTAAYRGGSMIPTQASALFYRVYDVLYPRLPRIVEHQRQERAIALATRTFCAAAGCMFTALFLERVPLTHLLVGRTDLLTVRVFALFCAIWLVNVPVHGLALLLISRGQNRVMTPVVLAEAAINIVVSIALVVLIGPIGAAVGTLATMAVSNLVVMPWVARKTVPGAMRATWAGAACCVLGIGAGTLLQAPASALLRGTAGVLAVAMAAVVSVVPAVWLAAGPEGRRILRAHV